MALYLIGLGLSTEKDVSLKGLELIKKCDLVYLENYTSLLQCSVKELEKLGTQWSEINQTNTDFYETRKKAEESHHNVQVLAHQSQEKHEEINKLYEEVKESRSQEQPFADKYLRLKAEYEEIKKKVDELQLRVTELAKLLKHPLFFVNLIAYNVTGNLSPSEPAQIKRFKDILMKAGVQALERYRFGQEIKGACGQLSGKNTNL